MFSTNILPNHIPRSSCFEVSLDAPGMENEQLHEKKNLSFGIGFTVDLKIWISQVDLSYACADPDGYGGPGPPGKSQIL